MVTGLSAQLLLLLELGAIIRLVQQQRSLCGAMAVLQEDGGFAAYCWLRGHRGQVLCAATPDAKVRPRSVSLLLSTRVGCTED